MSTYFNKSMSTSDQLWRALKDQVARTEEGGDTHSKQWRLSAPSSSDCMHCVGEGGVLVRCSHEKCRKEYHVECAFKCGGFFLEETGGLTFLCDVHFKPILFCKCLQPYDVLRSADMICCDECIEWFHCGCVDLTAKKAAAIEKYICPTCATAIREGRTPSAAVKAKNLEKESRSACHQDAVRSVRVLVEVAETVCPLLDQLKRVGSTDFHKVPAEFTADQMLEALVYLTNVLVPGRVAGAQEAAEPINFLGTKDLLTAWRSELQRFKRRLSDWESKTQADIPKSCQEIGVSLNIVQIESLTSLHTKLKDFEKEASNLFLTVETGNFLAFMQTFLEALSWLLEFLKMLHASDKTANWFKTLRGHFRAGGLQLRRLQGQLAQEKADQRQKEGRSVSNGSETSIAALHMFDFTPCMSLLRGHLDAAWEFMNQATPWVETVEGLLSEASIGVTLPQLNALVEQESGFPVRLPWADALKQLQAKAVQLEEEIQKCLSKDAVDMDEYGRLQTMAAAIPVQTVNAGQLEMVGDQLNFLQNYQSTVEEERIPFETVDQLRMLCVQLRESTAEGVASTAASLRLDQQISDAQSFLQQLCEESLELVGKATPFILQAQRNYELLIAFRKLRIITEEENILELLEESHELMETAEKIIKRTSETSLRFVEQIVGRFEAAIGRFVESNFEVDSLQRVATQLEAVFPSISSAFDEADQLWEVVRRSLLQCEHGAAESSEKFASDFQRARDSLIIDEETVSRAQHLQEKSAMLALEAERLLGVVNVESLLGLTFLEKFFSFFGASKHCTLGNDLAEAVQLRFDVLKVVSRCQCLLQQITGEYVTSASELAELKQLRSSMDHVTINHHNKPVEMALVTHIQPAFKVLCWLQEARHACLFRTVIAAAEQLREVGLELKLDGRSEFVELANKLKSALDVVHESESVRAKMCSSIEKSNSTIQQSPDMDLGTLKESLAAWNAETVGFEMIIAALIQRELEEQFYFPSLGYELSEFRDLLNAVRTVGETVVGIREAVSELTNGREFRCEVDFSDITTMANATCQLALRRPKFALLQTLSAALLKIHSDASEWSELAQSLIPARSSRRRHKPDGSAVSIDEIQKALQVPISKIVKMAFRDRLTQVVNGVTELRADLFKFLFRHDMDVDGGSNAGMAFEHQIFNDLCILSALSSKAELIPVDTEEEDVLGWLTALWTWAQTMPPPEQDDPAFTLSMEAAHQRHLEGNQMLKLSSSSSIARILASWGVVDEARTESGDLRFQNSVYSLLPKLQAVLLHLGDCISATEDFQFLIRNAIATMQPTEILQEYLGKVGNFKISPEPAIKKALENAVNTRLHSRQVQQQRYAASSSEWADDYEASRKKRQRLEAESRSPREILGKKKRNLFSASKCAARDCDETCRKSGESTSLYCSDSCATKDLEDKLQALLDYRAILLDNSAALRVNREGDANGHDPEYVKRADSIVFKGVENDRKAFAVAATNTLDALETVSGVVSNSCGVDNFTDLMERLDNSSSTERAVSETKAGEDGSALMVVDDEISSPDADLKEILSETENSYILALMKAGLPSDSKSRKGREDQLLHSRRSASMLGALNFVLPAAFLRLIEDDRNSLQSTPRGVTSNPPSSDQEMRKTVRNNFEDIAFAALNRLHIFGAGCMAAVLAVELEQELYLKYVTLSEKGNRRELDKKSYRQHQMTLQRNLKHHHNDRLILRLVLMELSVTNLLSMSPQQLADASTQAMRAAQVDKAVTGLLMTQSVQETLESRCRVAMEGAEAPWRSGAKTDATMERKAPDLAPRLEPIVVDTLELSHGNDSFDDPTKEGLEEEIEQPTTPTEDLQTANSKLAASSPSNSSLRRPLSVDAVTRFTTDRPKQKREPSEEAEETRRLRELDEKRERLDHDAVDEPARPKPPSMLEMLKSAAVMPKASPTAATSAIKADSLKPSSEVMAVGPVLMISTTATSSFLIQRPGTHAIECIGCVSDKRVHGLIKPEISIEGRTRIADLERFLSQVIGQGKKLVATFRLFASRRSVEAADSAYRRFCDEFAKDNRAGVCNVSESVQVYIIPPALKNALSILACTPATADSDRSLYGIVISRDSGPEYLTRKAAVPVSYDHPPSPETIEAVRSQAASIESPGPSAALSTPAVETPTPSSSSVPPVQQPLPNMDVIRKVAKFCAENGTQTIRLLKEKPGAKNMMPFLFEDQPGFEEFQNTLKEILYGK